MDPRDYRKTFEVRWADLDPNRHVRSTAYADYATDTRLAWLVDQGFPLSRFEEHGFGPVLLREDSRFYREVMLGETITVSLQLSGSSADGSHWRFRQEVQCARGPVAATVEVEGGWIDLRTRRFIAPLAELVTLVASLSRSQDFAELPTLIRPGP
ncbi:MAG: thioesterase [Chloroflexales bacterium]|nr:thioesterase [Chloroflexales bacterium]